LIKNNRVYAMIDIRNRNGLYVPIRFKLDSGADRTTISLNDLEKLGYSWELIKLSMVRNGRGSLASGEESAHFEILLQLNHIFKQIIPKGLNFPFLCAGLRIIEAPKPSCSNCHLTGEFYTGFRSLLGNDLLSCFDMTTEWMQRKVHLTRIADLTERNKVYPWCEVHSLESSDNL